MSLRRCQYCGSKTIDDGANGHVFCSTCIEKTNQRVREMHEDFKFENLKTPPIFIKEPDYKAKYEELQKAYIKQIDQTQDVIDKYMSLADKYSDLVDKHTELKKG